MDALKPGTPQWWVERLAKKLADKQPRYELLSRYATGDHPLPEGDQRARDLFLKFQRKARTNYTGLVISSVKERLHVVGFRSGSTSSTTTDSEAWRIWQANHLDADSALVHDAALTFSDAYVMVGPNSDDPTTPIITVESPRTCIVEEDPLNRRKLLAGLKSWRDEASGYQRAVLYLPEQICYYQKPLNQAQSSWFEVSSAWAPLDQTMTSTALDAEGSTFTMSTPNPLGEVPIVRFVNRPTIGKDGWGRDGLGEFEDAIDIQDRINNGVLDRLVVSKLQAYRQRWVKGIPTEDENGNPVDLPFVPGVDLLWAVEDETVEWGEFQQVDLTPMLKAHEADVKAFVAQTGLPPHYIAGDLVNASADALAAAEARLVAKIRDHQRYFEECWEQVIGLAFKWVGDTILEEDAEVIWADPERKTEAQLADAAVKKGQAGVPWRQRMEDLDYTPQQIDRMEVEKLTESLQLNAGAPNVRITDTTKQDATGALPLPPDGNGSGTQSSPMTPPASMTVTSGG